jgi:hypothetical protein
LNSDQPVKTARRRCPLTRGKHAFAPTNVRFARRVLTTCLRTSARIAAVDLFPDRSDRRGIGKATISLGRTRRVPKSSTGPLIRKSMLGFRQPSRPYRLTNDRGTKITTNAHLARSAQRARPDKSATLSRMPPGGSRLDQVHHAAPNASIDRGRRSGHRDTAGPTNKSVSWRGCNVVELRNGKAIRGRLYADNASLLQQLGVLSLPKAKAAG